VNVREILCSHNKMEMYKNGKMRLVEAIPVMRGEEDKVE
jgi:hypothetical protein